MTREPTEAEIFLNDPEKHQIGELLDKISQTDDIHGILFQLLNEYSRPDLERLFDLLTTKLETLQIPKDIHIYYKIIHLQKEYAILKLLAELKPLILNLTEQPDEQAIIIKFIIDWLTTSDDPTTTERQIYSLYDLSEDVFAATIKSLFEKLPDKNTDLGNLVCKQHNATSVLDRIGWLSNAYTKGVKNGTFFNKESSINLALFDLAAQLSSDDTVQLAIVKFAKVLIKRPQDWEKYLPKPEKIQTRKLLSELKQKLKNIISEPEYKRILEVIPKIQAIY